MRAGMLDERIVILAPTTVIDDFGAERETWATVVETWAHKREIQATEVLRNPQIIGELDAIFTIRHPQRELDATMRLRDHADRLYEIRGISSLPGRRVGYEIQARGLDKTGATVA